MAKTAQMVVMVATVLSVTRQQVQQPKLQQHRQKMQSSSSARMLIQTDHLSLISTVLWMITLISIMKVEQRSSLDVEPLWWTSFIILVDRFQKTTGLNWVVWLRPSKSSLATWLRPYLLSSSSKLKIARCFDKTNCRSIFSTVLAIHLFIENQSFYYASITIMPKSVIRESQALFHF